MTSVQELLPARKQRQSYPILPFTSLQSKQMRSAGSSGVEIFAKVRRQNGCESQVHNEGTRSREQSLAQPTQSRHSTQNYSKKFHSLHSRSIQCEKVALLSQLVSQFHIIFEFGRSSSTDTGIFELPCRSRRSVQSL